MLLSSAADESGNTKFAAPNTISVRNDVHYFKHIINI